MPKKTGMTIVLIIVVAAFLTACKSSGESDLTGKVWVLTDLNGDPPVAGTTITIEFTTNGDAGGSAGCNRYAGKYITTGNKIEFTSPMASTMMACLEPVMNQESAYLKALSEVKTFAINADQLTLSDSSGALATYQAQSQDLSGTSWLVTGYNNGKQAVVSVIGGTELTTDFGKDGTVSGSSGCNTYNGTYKVDGDKITIGPLASTRMACNDPEGVMDQESQFLAALQSAKSFKIDGSKMEMRTAEGALAVSLSQK